VLEDVLAHHDRVVDEQADRQREAEQRHHVEREAQRVHQEERGDDAGRQGEALMMVERRSSMKTRMIRIAIAPPKTMAISTSCAFSRMNFD
jgi:type IV secretory pathway VirD2 relaxase